MVGSWAVGRFDLVVYMREVWAETQDLLIPGESPVCPFQSGETGDVYSRCV